MGILGRCGRGRCGSVRNISMGRLRWAIWWDLLNKGWKFLWNEFCDVTLYNFILSSLYSALACYGGVISFWFDLNAIFIFKGVDIYIRSKWGFYRLSRGMSNRKVYNICKGNCRSKHQAIQDYISFCWLLLWLQVLSTTIAGKTISTYFEQDNLYCSGTKGSE